MSTVVILDIETVRDDLRTVKRKIKSRMKPLDLSNVPKSYTTESQINSWKEKTTASWESELENKIDKAALDSTLGKVVIIGIKTPVTVHQFVGDEKDILVKAWDIITKVIQDGGFVTGLYILTFDLPFMIQRSYILGVPVPRLIRENKWLNKRFVDLIDIWCAGRKDFPSLELLAEEMGIGKKITINKDLTDLWKKNPDKVMEYNLNDLELEAKIAARMAI